MKSKKWVIALGLVAVLLAAGGIAGCNSAESEQPANGQTANPLEDITNSDNPKQQDMQTVGWPEGSPAASGIIEKLAGNTFDLREERIAVPSGRTETKIWQVVFSSDTKVLRPKFFVGKAEVEAPEELSVYDLEEGQNVTVWGEVNGNRIFADTIATTGVITLK